MFDLGHSSDTLDVEGNVTELDAQAVSKAELEESLDSWRGQIEQIPPKFSAVNINGRRAYDLARDGKDFSIPTRSVTIHALELLDFNPKHYQLRIECSTGTYIRTLGSDIAKALGTDAVMSQLTRTRVGRVHLESCVELDTLKSVTDVASAVQPACELIYGMPIQTVDTGVVDQIRNGVKLNANQLGSELQNFATPERFAAVDETHNLVGIMSLAQSHYRSLRVFQNTKDMTQPKSISAPQSPES